MSSRLAALLLISLSFPAASLSSCRQVRCPGCRQLQGHDGVVYVANASEPAAAGVTVPTVRLLDALRDPWVRTIILLTNYTAAEFADHTNGPQVKLQRNVTLMAPPGLLPLLDVQFKRSEVHLCATCQAHLRNIVIANERRGNGAGVDLFVGDPGSSLVLEDSYRLRLACTSTDSTIELINREQFRSPRFPLPGKVLQGNSTQRQVLARNSVEFLGHNYTGMVKLVDFAYDVPVSFVEGQGLVGGFTMRTINTTRLCATTVSPQCLKVKAADACVNEAIDNLLAGRSKQASATAQQQAAASGSPSSPLLVAIVVPVAVVAGLLLAAGVILWASCARHRRQQRQLGKASSCSKPQPPPSELGGAGSSRQLADGASPSSSCMEQGDTEEGGADPFAVGDLGEPRADQGWEVVAVNTRPSLGAVGNAKIHWGRLLGAGSFGRVYQGRWAGLEAAVKCIEHDSESSKAVENEVQLMLSLDHPNVVKAYHYITYRHTMARGSKQLPTQSAPLPQPSIPTSPLSGASRSRQQREQKKQLQTLERQLQLDLGPKHQWLLDMRLGFAGHLSSNGSHDSLRHSSCSSNGSTPATGVSSSPAVVSTVLLSGQPSGQLSPHSTGLDSHSQMMGLTSTECADSICSGSSAVQQQQPNHKGWAPPDSLPPVQVLLPPLDRQGPDEEQDTPSSEQPGQALPASALLQQQQQQQQQQGPLQPRDSSSSSLTAAAADVRISLPDSPESTGGSLANSANGSAGSYPSTSQLLTPNQKVGLQRYLMRQHHLIQTSGMRVRSASAPLSPPVPVAGVAVKAQDVGAPGSGSDTRGLSDTPDTSGCSPRQPQELSRCRTYIVQEFCDLGTFTSYASKVLTDPCDEQQMLQLLVLLQDAARGIAALHSSSVVHGDVNARNVLVASSSTAPYGAVAKLADLGLSRVIRQQATHKTTNTVGTISHMPPEMLRHGRMSSAVDMYSYGIMMWEAFTGQLAFRHLHYGQFFECIVLNDMRPNVPEEMPRDYSMLMLACWSTNPADRPTADRVLEVLQLMVQERQALLAEAQHHGVWLQGEGQGGGMSVHPHPASEGPHAQGAQSAGSAGSAGQGRGVGGGAGCRAPRSAGLGVQGPLDGSSSGGSSLLLPV